MNMLHALFPPIHVFKSKFALLCAPQQGSISGPRPHFASLLL